MTPDLALLLIVAGIVSYPAILACSIEIMADWITMPQTEFLRFFVWIAGMVTLVMTALLLYLIPRMGELWAECGKGA